MTRSRVDGNQAALVKFIRSMGATWQHTYTIPGALDGIIGYRGVDVRCEIKDPSQSPSRRRLTPAEVETIREWKGRCPEIIETEADVLAIFKQIRTEEA